MKKILRALVPTTIIVLAVALRATPAYADMPHFTLEGTATAPSGASYAASLLVAFDLKTVDEASCGDGGFSGTCIILGNNTLYPSSLTVGSTTTNIVSGWGTLTTQGVTLSLSLTMRTADHSTIQIHGQANLLTSLASAVGFAKRPETRFGEKT